MTKKKMSNKMKMVKDPKTGKMVPEFAVKKAAGKMVKKKMLAGGKMVKKMMAKGKMVKGGAKGGKKKAKVRGAGIARKGVRPAKMV